MNGWRLYQDVRPACDWPVEWRNAMGQTWVGYSTEFRPEFNIDRLAWRHTGISMEMAGGDVLGYLAGKTSQQMMSGMLGNSPFSG